MDIIRCATSDVICVRTAVNGNPRWRARRDSNPRPPDSKSGLAAVNRI
jgi:hypothetical protein